MKRFLRSAVMAIIALPLVGTPAFAQSASAGIEQSGVVTPGHALKVITSGVAGDAGGAAGGPPGTGLSELGITNSGIGFCQNSGPTTLPYLALCLGYVGGVPTISENAYGGAPSLGLDFNLNGTNYQFPLALSGIVGPSSTTVTDPACWNNATGTLLKDCGPIGGDLGGSLPNPIVTGLTHALVTPSGGSVASSPAALAARIITPMDFGAKGDGVTNDTAAVQAAINAAGAAGAGGTLYLGHYTYCITGVTISATIRIIGAGYGSDNGTAPSGFVPCEANPPAMITLASGANGSILEGFGVWAGNDTTNASSGSAIVNNDGETVIRDILIRDACNAIHEVGNANKYLNLRINGTALQTGCIMVDVGSSSVQSIDPYFINNTIDSNNAVGATSTVGMLFENAGGMYVANNDILYMDYGTRILPGAGETVSGGIFNGTVLGDTTNKDSLDVSALTSTSHIYSLQFVGTWDGSCGNTARSGSASWSSSECVWITNPGGGQLTGVHFVGARMEDAGGEGVYVDGTVQVSIDGSTICGASEYSSGTLPAVEIDNTATQVAIRDSTIGADCDGNTGSVSGDINITSGAGNVVLTGNNLTDGTLIGSSPTSGVIENNYGVDNQEPPIASAATITAPLSPRFSLTGTTTVTTINGGWNGRELFIVDSGGAPLATGGNIASVPASFAANQLILCVFGGTDWACR